MFTLYKIEPGERPRFILELEESNYYYTAVQIRPTVDLNTAQNCASYSFDARIKTEMYCSYQYLSIDAKKVFHAHFNAHKPATNFKNRKYERGHLGNYQI